MLVGAQAQLNHECSQENAMLHWRMGNDKSINANLSTVQKAMHKLWKHQFVFVFKCWIARFAPNIFFTPHNILVNKKNRIIFDASRRFTPTSVPLNMMTSTRHGVKLNCDYGTVLPQVLVQIWNLCITYLLQYIILHANDVKSCFRQLKHHPDVMVAFSYIIGDTLYASCGLTFGSDFSPQTWAVYRRIAEQLATNIYGDKSLIKSLENMWISYSGARNWARVKYLYLHTNLKCIQVF